MAKTRKILDKRMVRIQAEAYYQAMKKYNEETKPKEQGREYKEETVWDKILLVVNVFFCPWKISKKFKINNRIYDGILVLIITGMFIISGTLLWGAGMFNTVDTIIKLIQKTISYSSMVFWRLILSVLMAQFDII